MLIEKKYQYIDEIQQCYDELKSQQELLNYEIEVSIASIYTLTDDELLLLKDNIYQANINQQDTLNF